MKCHSMLKGGAKPKSTASRILKWLGLKSLNCGMRINSPLSAYVRVFFRGGIKKLQAPMTKTKYERSVNDHQAASAVLRNCVIEPSVGTAGLLSIVLPGREAKGSGGRKSVGWHDSRILKCTRLHSKAAGGLSRLALPQSKTLSRPTPLLANFLQDAATT